MAEKSTILGQDPAILVALFANVLSWLVNTFCPGQLPRLLPRFEEEEEEDAASLPSAVVKLRTRCVVIGRPGGVEQLKIRTLKPGIATKGYNVTTATTTTAADASNNREGSGRPFTTPIVQEQDVPPDCVLIKNEAFSVNYADVCIRWGLYESANKKVGYPIVPGFDVAGEVALVGSEVKDLQVGDRIFGCSLFGAYSSRVLVPALQLRKIPADLTTTQAATLPAVSLTALYALFLAGHYPSPSRFNNKAILIHSAAGGVGSMLVQMSKLLGLGPIVGVVGRSAKVDAAKALGCHVVIDKSREDLWASAKAASPDGYAAIMESNGIATLEESYNHLAMTGRLIVFGFHTNLPIGRDSLSPMEWVRMARKASAMPKFDPMEMGTNNKAILAFNLSFFANEREMLSSLFDTVLEWLQQGKLECPRIMEMNMTEICDAHDLIQSGTTVGKLVLETAMQ